MSAPHKSPLHGLHPVQQPRQLVKPAVAQPKTALVGRPAAPPAYRPQPTPKVLQTKVTASSQPPAAPLGHKPQAPPPYRPQPTPKVLQTKSNGSSPPSVASSGRRPQAPPVYRPQPTPKILQTKSAAQQVNQPGRTPAAPPARRPQAVAQTAPLKDACTHGRACNPTLGTGGHHPTPGHLQMKDGGTRHVFPNPATGHPLATRRSSVAPQGPGPVAVQRSLAPGGTLTFTHNARTIQLKGDVVQPYFDFIWNNAGYIYDTLAASSLISTIIGTIATLCRAEGLGWIAPFCIPLVGTLVQGFLRIEDEERGIGQLTVEGRGRKYLELISGFINGFAGVVAYMIGSGAVTAAIVTSILVSIIMIALEALRINSITRETVWGLVKNKIQACRGVESQPILANSV